MMAIRVLIVDDNEDFRSWARVVLERAGYVVVGEAADGASAITAVRALSPELVLLDVQLPDSDGFEVARRLGEQRSEVAVVLISTRDASDYGPLIDGSCALGFLTKDALCGESLALLLATRDSDQKSAQSNA